MIDSETRNALERIAGALERIADNTTPAHLVTLPRETRDQLTEEIEALATTPLTGVGGARYNADKSGTRRIMANTGTDCGDLTGDYAVMDDAACNDTNWPRCKGAPGHRHLLIISASGARTWVRSDEWHQV